MRPRMRFVLLDAPRELGKEARPAVAGRSRCWPHRWAGPAGPPRPSRAPPACVVRCGRPAEVSGCPGWTLAEREAGGRPARAGRGRGAEHVQEPGDRGGRGCPRGLVCSR